MSLIEDFYADGKDACQALYSVAMTIAVPRLPKKMRHEAEDIAQECLVQIFRHKPNVTTEGQLKAYTTKVTTNKVTDFCRQHRAQKRGAGSVVSIEDALSHEFAWLAVCPLEEALHRLSLNDLHIILTNLSTRVRENHRYVLHDFYFEGLTHEEISVKRNINKKVVGIYISRALDRMRAALQSLPELRDELANHLAGPDNIRLLLPLIGICQPDVEDQTQYERRNSEADDAQPAISTRGPSHATRIPESEIGNSVSDEPSFIRILPEDKPIPAFLSLTAYERLRALLPTQTRHSAPQSPSKPTGCAAVVLVLLVTASLGVLTLFFRL